MDVWLNGSRFLRTQTVKTLNMHPLRLALMSQNTVSSTKAEGNKETVSTNTHNLRDYFN